MSLVVEDGSGRVDAESYESVANADSYHTKHGDPAAWSGASTPEKEEALRLATQYLDLVYGPSWRGSRANETQALNWPRSNVVDRDGFYISSTAIPQALKAATSEMALRHIQELAAGSSILGDLTDSAATSREKVKVGAIEIDTEYSGANPQYKKYRKVDLIVEAITRPGGLITRG